MKTTTIKSNDYIDFCNFGCEKTNTTNWCESRVIRVEQITGLDIDFGMLFVQTGYKFGENPLNNHGYNCLYSYHCWNTKNGEIFDSQNQVDAVREEDGVNPISLVGKKCVVFDIEQLGMSMLKKHDGDKFTDAIRKLQFKAKMVGADFIYFSGFSVNGYSGEVMTTEMFNQSLDLREKRIEKYMNTNLVMS